MNFILFIHVKEEQDFSYQNTILEHFKASLPSSDYLDLDSFSNPELLEHSRKALQLAEKSVVHFTFETEKNTGVFLPIATYLADHPEKVLVFINGVSSTIHKLLRSNETTIFYDLDSALQIQKTNDFLT